MKAHLLRESRCVKIKECHQQNGILPIGLGCSSLDFLVPASGTAEKISHLLLGHSSLISGSAKNAGKDVSWLSPFISHGIPPQQEEEYPKI